MSEEQVVDQGAIESEARASGWVPKEEFRDDESKWVDAETFVKRGREINPILRKHNQELKKELAEAKRMAEEAIETAKEFRKFQQETFERKQKEFEAQIHELKEAKKAAISQGDGDRAVEIDEQIDSIREEKASLKKPEETPAKKEEGIDPALQEWADSNSDWFGVNVEDTELANAIALGIRRENPTLMGKEFLDKLDERLEKRGVGKPKRKKPESGVEGGSGTRPNSSGGKRSYENLPADAKAACDRYVKQGLMTKEEYINAYDWE